MTHSPESAGFSIQGIQAMMPPNCAFANMLPSSPSCLSSVSNPQHVPSQSGSGPSVQVDASIHEPANYAVTLQYPAQQPPLSGYPVWPPTDYLAGEDYYAAELWTPYVYHGCQSPADGMHMMSATHHTNQDGIPVVRSGAFVLQNRGIVIHNLHYKAQVHNLISHFGMMGTIEFCEMLRSGIARIRFRSAEEATRAVMTLNNSIHMGRVIQVREDRDKTIIGQVGTQSPAITSSSGSFTSDSFTTTMNTPTSTPTPTPTLARTPAPVRGPIIACGSAADEEEPTSAQSRALTDSSYPTGLAFCQETSIATDEPSSLGGLSLRMT